MRDSSRITYPPFACLSALWLKVIALAAMICDHIGYTGLSSLWWLRLVGRLAFPIYVFLLVEGFYHTRSLPRYALRLLIFAALSELPFNYMSTLGRSWSYANGQNVMFTLLIGLLLVWLLDAVKRRYFITSKSGAARYGGYALGALLCAAATAAGCLLADFLKTDYGKWGVLLTAAMWLFRGLPPLIFASEVALFSFIMPRYQVYLPIFGGFTAGFYGFASLSIIPISLYNGKAGCKNKAAQYFFYASYGLHMLILGIIAKG